MSTIADRFCELWDAWNATWTVAQVEQLLGTPPVETWNETKQLLAGATNPPPTDSLSALRHAVAVDWVLGQVHPDRSDGSALPHLNWARTRHFSGPDLSSAQTPGALVFRMAQPADDDTLETSFPNLSRVPASLWDRVDHCFPDPFQELRSLPGPLRVGLMPFASDADLDIRRETLGDRPSYAVSPSPSLVTRVAKALDVLDASDIDIAVLPESTLGTETLRAWEDAISRKPAASGSRLRWILVGSGPINLDGGLPTNEAVLLDRGSGNALLNQPKRHRYRLPAWTIEHWKLEAELGTTDDLEEHMSPGRRIVVLESIWQRTAITVCEDLSRGVPLNADLCSVSPSLLLTPVLDAELAPRRWHEDAAQRWSGNTGSTVIVSNSLAIPRRMGRHDTAGTGAVGRPNEGFEVVETSTELEVAVVTIDRA